MSGGSTELLFVRPHVSMRVEEQEPTIGFLCLAREKDENSILFAWVPRHTIDASNLNVYLEVAARTVRDVSLLRQSSHASLTPHHTPPLPAIQEGVSAPLADVKSFALSKQLTLSNNEEICLVCLSVNLSLGGQLPDLWFDRNENGQASSLVDVETELNVWFRAVGRDIIRTDNNGAETTSREVPNVYELIGTLETLHPPAAALGRPSSPHRWPEGWPSVPEGSAIHRIGTLGFNVVSNIVGQPIADKIEDAGWNMLERFSKVTNYAKNTTVQVLEHPLARPILPLIPQNVRSYFLSSAEAEALLEEYEPAGHYLARFAQELQNRLGQTPPIKEPEKDTTGDFINLAGHRVHQRSGKPLLAEQWLQLFDESGKLTMSKEDVRQLVYSGGVDSDIRVQVWKYLLNVYPYDSTEKERAEIATFNLSKYKDMKTQWQSIISDITNAEAASLAAGEPIEARESQAGDEKEDADVVTKIKERKWRVEKDVVRTDRTIPFFASAVEDPNSDVNPVSQSDMQAVISASPNLEMLRNVLVTYTIHNFDLGYVQGMNDLLAPILVVMKDENEAFWCFLEFMNMMQSNFYRDQSGMRTQLRRLELLIKFMDPYLYAHMTTSDSINLFCCFRWLLILFKREFDFLDCMRLWEVLWACPLTQHFHLFVALAILNDHRKELMRKGAFDETLKYINELSGRLDLEHTLEHADVLFHVFAEKIGCAARERLGVDLAVEAQLSAGRVPSPQCSQPPTSLSGTPPLADRGIKSSETAPVSNSIDELQALSCTEEELWELVALLERR
ncbi:rab-GTPase-TBC domain-containing protein [Phlyctochytrium arcticum]|nr:rab-GTPase-TBC domain-containing protein [Phlyctochytrium arcticum]